MNKNLLGFFMGFVCAFTATDGISMYRQTTAISFQETENETIQSEDNDCINFIENKLNPNSTDINQLLELGKKFGFVELKNWWLDDIELSELEKKLGRVSQKKIKEIQNKRTKIEENQNAKVKEALTLKIQNDLSGYETLLQENIQNGCHKSMVLLGQILEEKGDAETNINEKHKLYVDAFSWYMLSFWIEASKGVTTSTIMKRPRSSYEKLSTIIKKKEGFTKSHLDAFKNIDIDNDLEKSLNLPVDTNKFLYKIIYLSNVTMRLMRLFVDFKFFDKKLISLSMYLCQFFSENQQNNLAKQLSLELNNPIKNYALELHAKKYYNEASFFFASPDCDNGRSALMRMIVFEYKKTDEKNIKLSPKTKEIALSKLLWKIKDNYIFTECLNFIQHLYGPSGNKLTTKDRNTLIKKIKKRIKSIEKNEIEYYRLLCNISLLMYQKIINNDLKGNEIITNIQRYNVIESLLTHFPLNPHSKLILALAKLSASQEGETNAKQEALNLLEESFMGGNELAFGYYINLLNELKSVESDSSEVNSSEDKQNNNLSSSESDDENAASNTQEIILPNDDYTNTSSSEINETNETSSSSTPPTYIPTYMTYDADYTSTSNTSTSSSQYELDELQRRNLKAFKKSQKQKERSRIFKKMLTVDISPEERNLLIPKNQKNTIVHKILWSIDAKEQLKTCSIFMRKRIFMLIYDIQTNGNRGNPEKLTGTESFSRRITKRDRLVYQFLPGDNVEILQCVNHYDD
ncbi:MAG: type II toxin-antitoxin system YoeB family toxin [Alphaproteobacteria bacterium]|nr:type II toxin-antitoxin system YoeB family toxin [Alphaproteobacteria bacterium]